MAEKLAEQENPETDIATVLENETKSETIVKVEGPEDTDNIEAKAKAKLGMMNIPTERKAAEDLAKMTSQVHAAEVHKSLDIQQGTVHPEHQTFGILGIPMAAAVHDYDLDRAQLAQSSVKTKQATDNSAIKEHNESLARIRKAIEEKNEQ